MSSLCLWLHLSCLFLTKLWLNDWAKSDHQSCLHRLYITLLTPFPAKIRGLTAATLLFSSTCCWVSFKYEVDWCSLGKNWSDPEPCDKFVWTAMTASRFFAYNIQHVTGLPLLWRSFPYGASLCQVLSDGMYLQAQWVFFSQHVTHSSAFLVHLTLLSVGGRKRERREKGRERESVSNGSWPWWFQANAFQGQRWHESSWSNLAWRNKTGLDWTHGLIHLIPNERMTRFCWRLAPPCDRISF